MARTTGTVVLLSMVTTTYEWRQTDMKFELIDKENWKRKEYFEHYFSTIPCTYSMTVRLDISKVIKAHRKLYPALLYNITKVVNRHPEFRTVFNGKGELGIYDEMIPCYTVFHKDTETFSNIWTPYNDDFDKFLSSYEQDIMQYGDVKRMASKPDEPENTFPVSMIPWVSFEGFNLNLQKGYDYLKPIFTIGRYCQENETTMIPIAIQVHHAVCDGFHVSRFVNELQEELNR